MQTKYPTRVDELPNDEFFAVLYSQSITIPGDERSRTNPGHGYPEHTESYWRMEVFPTREAWEHEIIKLRTSAYKREFKAIRAIPAKIVTSISVE